VLTINFERTTTMATRATFSPGAGLLSVFGDNLDNTIVASRDAAGTIRINNGAVSIAGGQPTVANTATIQVFGQGGNDTISLDETNGALPAAQLFGGAGNDTLTGGSGNDLLFGQAGNDRMIWNPGDDTDLNEGGDGIDTVEVNGGNGAEVFSVVPNGTRVRFDRVSPAPFSIDIGTSENLVLNANGGAAVCGAIAAQTFNCNGNFDFHYDLAFNKPRYLPPVRILSWTEL